MKILSFLFLIVLMNSCIDSKEIKQTIQGEAQGTTYSVSYYSKENYISKAEIDSILNDFDLSLSTYIPNSIVSALNRNDTAVIIDGYFKTVFERSMEISVLTDGFFDFTIAPIVNAWGFGFTEKSNVDSLTIAGLLKNIGYKKVKLINNQVIKENKNIMFDFNAIAQGYSVDVVADFISSRGIGDFMVEIGGEVRAEGKKPNNESWRVGIDKPIESLSERQLNAVIKLDNKSLATSGNYRKFYEQNGQKYSHTINPHTGFPTKNTLLSATVIAKDCMSADAFATFFMVIGHEKSIEFLKNNKHLSLEVYFIYEEQGQMKTYLSPGVIELLEELG
ncbi:MAG: FAD:protein FMN transferase [Bacteroidota bacterium]|nr:FAD:protein FMN transferase [Bacteroidota bacterium]